MNRLAEIEDNSVGRLPERHRYKPLTGKVGTYSLGVESFSHTVQLPTDDAGSWTKYLLGDLFTQNRFLIVREVDADRSLMTINLINNVFSVCSANVGRSLAYAGTLRVSGLDSERNVSLGPTAQILPFWPDQDAVTDAEPDQPIMTAFDRLDGAGRLTNGWAGAGSVAPTQRAVREARAFLDSLPLVRNSPAVNVAADGEIAMEWRNTKAYVLVTVLGDGKIGYAIRDAVGYHPDVEFDVGSRLPLALIKAILQAGG